MIYDLVFKYKNTFAGQSTGISLTRNVAKLVHVSKKKNLEKKKPCKSGNEIKQSSKVEFKIQLCFVFFIMNVGA